MYKLNKDILKIRYAKELFRKLVGYTYRPCLILKTLKYSKTMKTYHKKIDPNTN